jgi:hypothetical protein
MQLFIALPAALAQNSGIAGVAKDPVLTYNNMYGPRWQHPTAVLPGRLFKFSAQVDF